MEWKSSPRDEEIDRNSRPRPELLVLDELKEQVFQANLRLVSEGLVVQTWGNASGMDRKHGLAVIKPSGVPYDKMAAADMVVVALGTGKVVEGSLKPSSDTPTHLELYRAFPEIGGVVHTHSLHATAWAQACLSIPALGTTHADYWYGAVPCTRAMTDKEIQKDYEANTGRLIVETIKNPAHQSAVLVACHGPFTWGKDVAEAVERAAVLEFVARMAAETLALNPMCQAVAGALLDKHYLRKHGPGAYYGQAPPSNL
jgi:L-ribulose-5-phosphate 4-epimerase